MTNQNPEPKINNLAETTNFIAWSAEEADQEITYHIELNNVTLHFFEEEWKEFLTLINALK